LEGAARNVRALPNFSGDLITDQTNATKWPWRPPRPAADSTGLRRNSHAQGPTKASNHDLGSSSQLGKVKQQAVAMVTKSHFGNHGYLTQNNQRDFSRQHVDFIKKRFHQLPSGKHTKSIKKLLNIAIYS